MQAANKEMKQNMKKNKELDINYIDKVWFNKRVDVTSYAKLKHATQTAVKCNSCEI